MTISERPDLHASLAQPAPRRTRPRLRQHHRWRGSPASHGRLRDPFAAKTSAIRIPPAARAEANHRRRRHAGPNDQLKTP